MRKIYKAIVPCLLSAVLLALPFINGKFWILAWVGFVPVFFALNNKSKRQAFLLFFVTGIIFWSGIIYWLAHVTLAGTIALILYLALYFAIFGLIIRPCTKRSTPYALIFIPSVWVLLEYIRGHLFTGLPWALLGYSQYLNLPVIQIADITGAWGVSFLVMMVNVVIYSVTSNQKPETREIKKIILPISFIIFSLVYGYYRLCLSPLPVSASPAGRRQADTTYDLRSKAAQSIRVSVIQGNIPQDLKWEVTARDFIINKYAELTRQAARDNPDLIIWPEAALPVVLEIEPQYYEKTRNLVRELRIPLLLGAVTLEDEGYYNSAILIAPDGRTQSVYHKLHLVPFGEYIPLRKIFTFLETIAPIGDITAGNEYTVFTQPIRFSVLICFEDLFPELSRRFVGQGAEFLVNITNDAWYKKTPASYQHLAASVFRAVENRVTLVRAANTGISCFIAPSGRIISSVKDKPGSEIFVDGYDSERIFLTKKASSFYNRWGEVFILLLFIFSLYGIFRSIRLAPGGLNRHNRPNELNETPIL